MPISYLLDTTVFSDVLKSKDECGDLHDWFLANIHRSHISTVTLHELWFGVERLALRKSMDSRNRAIRLRRSYSELANKFAGRVIDPDLSILWKAAELRARAEVALADIEIADATIAATAVIHDLAVVTRNVEDFSATGAAVFDSRLASLKDVGPILAENFGPPSPKHLRFRPGRPRT